MSKDPHARMNYMSAFGDWMNWQKGKPLPEPFRHWTRCGTVAIRPTVLSGSLMALLEFKGEFLATFNSPGDAAKAIATGEFDKDLPEPASALRISSRTDKWNGMK